MSLTEVKPIGVGGAIQTFRVMWGLSVGDVAKRTRLSPQFLSQIERDARAPSMASLNLIATALNVPANLLLRLAGRNPLEVAAHLDTIKQ